MSEVDAHPTRKKLESFVLGDLCPGENLRVFLHLLPGCSHCREITAALWRSGAGVESDAAAQTGSGYETAVDRACASVLRAHAQLAAERAAAPLLLAELGRLPEEHRQSVALADPRFRIWGLCELLAAASREPGRELRRAEACGLLAAALAERLDPAAYAPPLAADLAARCWGAVAEVRRGAGEWQGAEEALETAEAHLRRGTGDRLQRAWMLELRAALCADQGRCADAVFLLRRASALYRRAGQLDLLGRSLVAALLVFQKAVRARSAALAFVRQIAGRVGRPRLSG